jgi:hypothetical protein
VDRRLGANDPQFAQYARNYKAVERKGEQFSYSKDKKDYLDAKRAEEMAQLSTPAGNG